MVVALALPLLLALLTLPFTVLRIILLGWNCSLSRQKVTGSFQFTGFGEF